MHPSSPAPHKAYNIRRTDGEACTLTRIFGISVAIIFALITQPAIATPDETHKYPVGDGTDLTMHVFVPDISIRSGKAVIFYFGGGWRVGSPKQFFPFCAALKARGIACFAPDYRVLSRQGTDAVDALHDAQSAYQWVISHGDKFGVDKSQIYVGGGSAGGHLAAAVAILPDKSTTQAPAGMLLFNPAVDIGRSSRIQELFRNEAKQYSPIEFVRPSLAGAWIVHGTADKTVPFGTVVDFCQRMEAAGNLCELTGFDGAEHGFFNAGRPDYDEVLSALLAHLDK